MKEKGQLIKRGALSEDGDLELWDDGSQTQHEPPAPRTPSASNDAPYGASFAKKP